MTKSISDLVPPFELCRQIPKPKKNFRDSYFAWVPRFSGRGGLREIVKYELCVRPSANDSQCIPAPTLQEILAELPQHWQYIGTGKVFEKDGKGFYTTDLTDAEKFMRFWLFINKKEFSK